MAAGVLALVDGSGRAELVAPDCFVALGVPGYAPVALVEFGVEHPVARAAVWISQLLPVLWR